MSIFWQSFPLFPRQRQVPVLSSLWTENCYWQRNVPVWFLPPKVWGHRGREGRSRDWWCLEPCGRRDGWWFFSAWPWGPPDSWFCRCLAGCCPLRLITIICRYSQHQYHITSGILGFILKGKHLVSHHDFTHILTLFCQYCYMQNVNYKVVV
jgi:hypothetical protein